MPGRRRRGFVIWVTGASGSNRRMLVELIADDLRHRGYRVEVVGSEEVIERARAAKGLIDRGAVVICEAPDPSAESRRAFREAAGRDVPFVDVHLKTGGSSKLPVRPDVTLDVASISAEECRNIVLSYLIRNGLIASALPRETP